MGGGSNGYGGITMALFVRNHPHIRRCLGITFWTVVFIADVFILVLLFGTPSVTKVLINAIYGVIDFL